MVTSPTIKTLSPENTTVLEANLFPIKSVKLFRSGGAEVTRTFPLPFLRFQDEPHIVEIVHLPASLQSVNVSVTSPSPGDVTILDHYHNVVGKDTLDRTSTAGNQKLRELEAERLQLQNERRLREQSFMFLTTYMDSLAQCKSQTQSEAAQMVTFFDEFVEIGIARSSVFTELDGKLADIDGRIKEETERLSKLNRDLSVKVVAVLLSNNQLPVEAPSELSVTYVVKEVSWKPEYDLHVSMTGHVPSSSVTVEFRCTVTQWTGEDWENVTLALTTADQVSHLIQPPEPKRVDLSLSAPHINFPRPSAISPPIFGMAASAPIPSKPAHRFQPDGNNSPRDPRAQVSLFGSTREEPSAINTVSRMREVEVEEPRTVSELTSQGTKDPIVHTAGGRIFIPSDRTVHRVLVASLSLQGDFTRVVVPSVDTRVYYTCEAKNTSEYVLLPGTVKAYLNDKHVSSTEVQTTDLPQILECSLAVDTGLKTTHNRTSEALPSSVGAFTGKSTTTYTSATVLHNTRADPIRGVVVRNIIPLPADPRITIMLKEPAGLAEIEQGSVSVKEGCIARWSTTGGRKGKQAGLFEWVCDVDPGTEVLKAVWEVSAPQDLKLVELPRS